MFADDIALTSNEHSEIQTMLNIADNFCRKRRLKFGLDKCAFLVENSNNMIKPNIHRESIQKIG